MSADFNAMLNDHLHYGLLKEELEKKSYLWKTLEHDDDVSGDIIVPFQAARSSSIKRGAGPTAVADITKHAYTRGSVALADIPKVWGSMIFNWEDILNHDGRVKQKSFLGTFLPAQVEDFTEKFAEDLNHAALNQARKDTAVAAGDASGNIEVNRIERYEVGEYLVFEDGEVGWVKSVNINTNIINVVTALGGSTGVDLTTVEAGDDIFKDGAQTAANQMTSLRDALLSAANGGDTNIYGVAKTASPYTQAINVSGSAITASNILEKLFDAIATFRQKSKVGKTELWMSFKHLGSVMKILEQDKGPYKMEPGSMKVNEYGFTEINIFGPKTGAIKIVGLQEMDNDVIFGIDTDSVKFHSVKGIQKVKTPDGNLYTVNRSATTGFDFVCDLYYRGDLIVSKPHRNFVVYSISY